MIATKKQNYPMNTEDLSKLSLHELRKIMNRNFVLFHLLAITDLIVFYHSLIHENWGILFLTFGAFVAGLALYDNYRLSKSLVERDQPPR